MSLGNWFRRLFSSPAEPAKEEEGATDEAYVAPEGEPDLERIKHLSGGAAAPGVAPAAGAEAAEAELSDLEPPPDPAP